MQGPEFPWPCARLCRDGTEGPKLCTRGGSLPCSRTVQLPTPHWGNGWHLVAVVSYHDAADANLRADERLAPPPGDVPLHAAALALRERSQPRRTGKSSPG